MKAYVFIVLLACVYAADKMEETSKAQEQSKDKRQTQGEVVIAGPAHLVYRTPRRQKEQVAPVEESQEDDKPSPSNRADVSEEYRPGQVISLNARELLELQPERRAPIASGQHLQQLYSTDPLPEHKQNLQQFYIFEPQVARQVQFQPSHAVIARPSQSSDGGEASVGAALSVSDAGGAGGGGSGSHSFDRELLALLGHGSLRGDHAQAYTAAPQVTSQSSASQYSQIERYVTKPTKKATKLRTKVQSIPAQVPSAPQQYLIETTNVQQQPQAQPQLRPVQQSRAAQALRYVTVPTVQPTYYPVPENQGIKIVAAPKLQQSRPQVAYRFVPQYQQQQEASPKQFRVIDAPRPTVRAEITRPSPSVERPIAYLKRYPDVEKMRSANLYEQSQAAETVAAHPQSAQIIGDHYYIRPVYRTTDQRGRYQLAHLAVGSMDQTRALEPTKSPYSSIYVNKNVVPKKVNPTHLVRVDQPIKEQSLRIEQPSKSEQQSSVEINGQSLEEQRSHLPPPRNNRAYTPDEFAALLAAGYSVTPIPVGSLRSSAPVQYAQSRSSVEPSAAPTYRRPLYSRRHQYLPLRGDDAP